MPLTIYILAFLFVIYFIIRVLSKRMMEKIPVAFAGAYDGSETVVSIPKSRNNTIYTEGDNVVNLDSYTKYIISGKSLEKVGIADGSYIYTSEADEDLYSMINRFVIFRYDNKRLAEEHPEIKNPVEAFKARKVASIFHTKLSKADFEGKMSAILSSDAEIKEIAKCIEYLWRKYSFASKFYNEADSLIVSITYKDNGTRKDYSFHSPAFLIGVVKYKSIS